MILSARFCTLSSLRLSEALQKCQIVWQYDKLGIIAVRYKWSLVSQEMRLRSLANTPTFWLAFLHMSLTWSLKESSSSMNIPSIFRFLVDLICWCSIVMVHVSIAFLSPRWGAMTRIWYLFGLAWRRLALYHCDTVFVSFLRKEATDSMRVPLKYTWWSSAYINKLLVCTLRDKSFWNRFQRSGPNYEPWGQPLAGLSRN